MNSPFFMKQPTRRSVPLHQPKVISVPVHFISSDQPPTTLNDSNSPTAAAITIQRVFRGYVVRTIVRKIASIRNQVSEIERTIEDPVVVNLIRKDAKERLRLNEALMSLLFKLDSIHGVYCGIRDLRKAVTRKAIALQEKVDSIAQSDYQTLDHSSDEIGIGTGIDTSTSTEQVAKTSDSIDEEGKLKSPEFEKRSDGELQRDDNEKVMKLMTQICERNEMQTRMINMLSRRVEKLEKALVSEKQRSRKKKTVRRGRDMCMLSLV